MSWIFLLFGNRSLLTLRRLRNVSPARLSVNSTEEYVRACATINDIYPSLCRVTPSDVCVSIERWLKATESHLPFMQKRAAHARGRNVYTKLPSPPSTSILGAQPEHMQLMDVDPLGPSTASSASPMEVQPPPIQRKLTEMCVLSSSFLRLPFNTFQAGATPHPFAHVGFHPLPRTPHQTRRTVPSARIPAGSYNKARSSCPHPRRRQARLARSLTAMMSWRSAVCSRR